MLPGAVPGLLCPEIIRKLNETLFRSLTIRQSQRAFFLGGEAERGPRTRAPGLPMLASWDGGEPGFGLLLEESAPPRPLVRMARLGYGRTQNFLTQQDKVLRIYSSSDFDEGDVRPLRRIHSGVVVAPDLGTPRFRPTVTTSLAAATGYVSSLADLPFTGFECP